MLKKYSTLALAGLILVQASVNAVTLTENFSTNPLATGWKIFGETNLFQWDPTNQNLRVTWDSSRANSYFHRSLGTILATNDNFALSFDLRLSDIAIGVNTNKPFTFQIALGFLNLANATNANFIRGSGFQSPNLVELDYFPDSGFGATISPTIISSNQVYANGGFSFPFELTPNDLFHVAMNYTASNQIMKTLMTKNGAAFGPIADVYFGTNFTDFRVDTLAVSSYSDAGQDPGFSGSILAHGVVDNFVVTVPNPPIENLAGGFTNHFWQMQFNSRTNFIYVLERTTDLQAWTTASSTAQGNGGALVLQDTNSILEKAFYRVRADRP